ncbi:MAG: alpha-galactosidase [Candidatus Azotimanducaceae bacterium]|jgi:alpha-galactosidase
MKITAQTDLDDDAGAFYQHGWHSWCVTGWRPRTGPVRYPMIAAHRRQATDPAHLDDPLAGGSGVGAVETGEGQISLLGALDVDHWVSADSTSLQGNGAGAWFQAQGEELDVFNQYAYALSQSLGWRKRRVGSVWCSWYSFYHGISEQRLERVLHDLAAFDFDVFQIDDGWQKSNGDWQPNSKFASGMAAMASRISSCGKRPGLWLAPFLIDESSAVFKRYSQMLLRDDQGALVVAAENWGGPTYTLDVTRADSLHWLAERVHDVVAQGYTYLKLDFLYSAALPGRYHTPQGREAAYRAASQVIREAAGDETYLLACGAPIIASVGIYDGIRVGPDVSGSWDNIDRTQHLNDRAGPGAADAITTSLGRYWLASLIDIDPDVAYFRSQYCLLTSEQKRYLADLAHVCDFRANSDLPAWLSPDETQTMQRFLAARPEIKQTGRYAFMLDDRRVDFTAIAAARPW